MLLQGGELGWGSVMGLANTLKGTTVVLPEVVVVAVVLVSEVMLLGINAGATAEVELSRVQLPRGNGFTLCAA